jgi:hypothetical protein
VGAKTEIPVRSASDPRISGRARALVGCSLCLWRGFSPSHSGRTFTCGARTILLFWPSPSRMATWRSSKSPGSGEILLLFNGRHYWPERDCRNRCRPYGTRFYFPLSPALKRWAKIFRPIRGWFWRDFFHCRERNEVATQSLKGPLPAVVLMPLSLDFLPYLYYLLLRNYRQQRGDLTPGFKALILGSAGGISTFSSATSSGRLEGSRSRRTAVTHYNGSHHA